jgi:hypothetical protein
VVEVDKIFRVGFEYQLFLTSGDTDYAYGIVDLFDKTEGGDVNYFWPFLRWDRV